MGRKTERKAAKAKAAEAEKARILEENKHLSREDDVWFGYEDMMPSQMDGCYVNWDCRPTNFSPPTESVSALAKQLEGQFGAGDPQVASPTPGLLKYYKEVEADAEFAARIPTPPPPKMSNRKIAEIKEKDELLANLEIYMKKKREESGVDAGAVNVKQWSSTVTEDKQPSDEDKYEQAIDASSMDMFCTQALSQKGIDDFCIKGSDITEKVVNRAVKSEKVLDVSAGSEKDCNLSTEDLWSEDDSFIVRATQDMSFDSATPKTHKMRSHSPGAPDFKPRMVSSLFSKPVPLCKPAQGARNNARLVATTNTMKRRSNSPVAADSKPKKVSLPVNGSNKQTHGPRNHTVMGPPIQNIMKPKFNFMKKDGASQPVNNRPNQLPSQQTVSSTITAPPSVMEESLMDTSVSDDALMMASAVENDILDYNIDGVIDDGDFDDDEGFEMLMSHRENSAKVVNTAAVKPAEPTAPREFMDEGLSAEEMLQLLDDSDVMDDSTLVEPSMLKECDVRKTITITTSSLGATRLQASNIQPLAKVNTNPLPRASSVVVNARPLPVKKTHPAPPKAPISSSGVRQVLTHNGTLPGNNSGGVSGTSTVGAPHPHGNMVQTAAPRSSMNRSNESTCPRPALVSGPGQPRPFVSQSNRPVPGISLPPGVQRGNTRSSVPTNSTTATRVHQHVSHAGPPSQVMLKSSVPATVRLSVPQNNIYPGPITAQISRTVATNLATRPPVQMRGAQQSYPRPAGRPGSAPLSNVRSARPNQIRAPVQPGAPSVVPNHGGARRDVHTRPSRPASFTPVSTAPRAPPAHQAGPRNTTVPPQRAQVTASANRNTFVTKNNGTSLSTSVMMGRNVTITSQTYPRNTAPVDSQVSPSPIFPSLPAGSKPRNPAPSVSSVHGVTVAQSNAQRFQPVKPLATKNANVLHGEEDMRSSQKQCTQDEIDQKRKEAMRRKNRHKLSTKNYQLNNDSKIE